MKQYLVLLSALALLVITGCSSKQMYEAFQPKYNEAECRKEHEVDYEKCMKQQAKSYEEYEKERQSIINKK